MIGSDSKGSDVPSLFLAEEDAEALCLRHPRQWDIVDVDPFGSVAARYSSMPAPVSKV